jgi:hypothetical protein
VDSGRIFERVGAKHSPAIRLCRRGTCAKRDLALPRALPKLDAFEVIILDDRGGHPTSIGDSRVKPQRMPFIRTSLVGTPGGTRDRGRDSGRDPPSPRLLRLRSKQHARWGPSTNVKSSLLIDLARERKERKSAPLEPPLVSRLLATAG